MFIGHFAVAFGVKRVAPEANLGIAILATALLDVIWPFLVAAGIEVVRIDPGNTAFTPLRFVSYPFSHSLAMAALWAVLFAWAYRSRGGSRRAAVWLGLVVVSHWFLDLIVHRPDLQLLPEVDVYVGLGLWDSVAATLLVEGLMFAAGLWLYLSATRTRDRIGTWGLWGLVALLLVSYAAAGFGPPPPDVTTIVIADIVGTALAVTWAYWVDRHRDAVVAL
jgi:membrane-bound metal-dependent hydrolase YbcI (DUF457 family)